MDQQYGQCLHQLFEAQVERTPEATALLFNAEKLTYRELDCRANQLAHFLISLGVGPEVLVGLCVERSMEMVISILGILKAGGAYVPLSPAYPAERLAFMIEDSRVPHLITQERLHARLPPQVGKVLTLEQFGSSDIGVDKASWSMDATAPQRANERPVQWVKPGSRL